MKRTTLCAAVFGWLVLLAAGCGDGADGAGRSRDESPMRRHITVFAAASLTDAFTELGDRFERQRPNTTVTFNFAGSPSLREQILAGAPADVYASANRSTMDAVVEAGAVGAPAVLATNRLAIAVPRGNPGQVRSLADFGRDDLLLGVCAEAVPCGELARAALARNGITPAVDTNVTDVRALLTQVASGDLDAGIVYHSDLASAGAEVEGIEIPPAHNLTTPYLIAVVADSRTPELAAAFVAFVLGDDGQRVLASHGFDPR